MMLAETVLSLMLSVGPAPGVSPHSVVVTTSKARPCADMRPLCRLPWFSAYHKALVRQENYAEGLKRYWVIAQSIATVADDDHDMATMLVNVALFESKYRRDIHSGRGLLALGDHGRSWSIVQARLGRGAKKGYRLIGITPAATGRALSWAAKHLRRCTKRAPAWAAYACYGGVSNGADHPGIQARIASHRRLVLLREAPRPLSKTVRTLLGLPPDKTPQTSKKG
jgi:hypothetical protein